MTAQNVLQISQAGKGIPYGGTGEIRPDGHANYGFKALKGAPGRLAEVPELAADPALRALVSTINGTGTGLLSVGCLSDDVSDDSGHRVSGYIEFAFNSAELIGDATNYFPLFFHFDQRLFDSGFADRVQFHWELMGAIFHEAGAGGFTAAVTVNTGHFADRDGARAAWDRALGVLALHLGEVGPVPGRPLYLDGSPIRGGLGRSKASEQPA